MNDGEVAKCGFFFFLSKTHLFSPKQLICDEKELLENPIFKTET
jgi:hypothetical protein